MLLGACNDTRDLAPASPDTPWQFEPSKEAPPPAAAPAAAKRFTVPENTAVQLPSPADIEPNHAYSLVELIDIAQRRNPTTRVAWEQAQQAAINVGIARAAYLPARYRQINLSRAKRGSRRNEQSRCRDRDLPVVGGFGSEDPKRRSRDKMALEIEGIVDDGMHAEETLGGSSRFEPPHLALSSSHHLMRIFCPIILSEPLFMRAAQS